jgi:hypothetical protein
MRPRQGKNRAVDAVEFRMQPDARRISLGATALGRRRVRCCAGLALALMWLIPAVAEAGVRKATLKDGVDPTLTYDVQRVRAKLDRSAGRLDVSVRLHRPFPTALDGSYWAAGIAVSVNGAPSGGDCRGGSDTVGATRLFIKPGQPAPTPELPEIHQASARVSYGQETTPVPLTFTADRRTASVTVENELLRGADLRCLSVNSIGRSTYDPRQPDGGPAIEQPLGAYFAGFSPRAQLRRALRRCATRHDSKRDARRRAGCKRRARAHCRHNLIGGVHLRDASCARP